MSPVVLTGDVTAPILHAVMCLIVETLNLLRLNQREVLARVPADSEVPVPDNAHSTFDCDALTLQLRRTALRADEDAFNDHYSLLEPSGLDERMQQVPTQGSR
jgi:hypothetical protein